MSQRFTDFARNEIYAFIRLTAILTTFIVAVSFSLLTLSNNSGTPFKGPWQASFFWLTIIVGIFNIIFVWGFLKRTLFKYYSKLDQRWRLTDEQRTICDNIEKKAGKWRQIIWWSFLSCLSLFIIFLVISIF